MSSEPLEYPEARQRYVDFVFNTGMTIPQLRKLHKDAVKAVDVKHEDNGLTVRMEVKPEIVAYLTDLALRHLPTRGQYE